MKTTRILSIVPPSNYPNFQADSIYTSTRILLDELAHLSDVNINIAAPPEAPRGIRDANYMPMEFGRDQYHVRFGLDWNETSKLLKTARPDICYLNMPEHASTVAILIREVLKISTKIVTYVHYIPAWIDPALGGS